MPVFHVGGNVDHRARQDLPCGFSLLLIPAPSGYADEHLPAAALRPMDVPVVAAARLEGHVGNGDLLARNRGQVAVAGEILCEGRVRLADREDHFALEGGPGIFAGGILRPDLLGETECRPRLGPAGVEADVGDDLGDLGAGDAVLLRRLKMVGQRTVRDALADERSEGYQTAVAQAEAVGAAPHLAEEHVVVEFREFGREIAELVASGRLYDFFLCHNVECKNAE